MRKHMNVSAESARKVVDAFVLSHVSYMMHAGEPLLVSGRQLRWRVPVILSLTSCGDVGEVGTIDVDATSGQMQIDPQLLRELNQRAQMLAPGASPAPTE
jgi:hypothetical protein